MAASSVNCVFSSPTLKLCFFLTILSKLSTSIAPPYYGMDRPSLEYELPPLDYGFSELEPYLNEETVRVHYLGHHSKYTENMNGFLKEWRVKDKIGLISRISVVDILRNLSAVPIKWRESIRNNGGGFVNHNIYWSVMSPNPKGIDRLPSGSLAADIESKWSSFDAFQKAFTEQAIGLFGSGYVWLCRNYTTDRDTGELSILTTANQDSPISLGVYPIAVIDLWEHAYYLLVKNLRPKYIANWWRLLDWEAVDRLDEWWKRSRQHDEL